MVDADSPMLTLRKVAALLDEDVETIFEIACDMSPADGCVTVLDDAFSLDEKMFIGTAFTNDGIDFIIARLAANATSH
jgi:hypothetical protein